MQYENYLARKRARFEGICGHVNIPYGTALTVQDGFIMWKGQQVCGITSQNAYDYFTQNDDGRGKERGELVSSILLLLERRDNGYQSRWNKVWRMPVANSTSARITMIIGFGTLSSIMPRWRI